MEISAINGKPIVKCSNRVSEVSEYYFSQKLREIESMRESGINIINLGIGNPDLPPSHSAIKVLESCACNTNNHGYQSYAGLKELRDAFSVWYKSYFDTHLDPDNEILPLMGSKEGIMHISMAFVNPGEQVLVPDPGYPAYSAITRLIGGEVIKYNLTPENNWYPNLSQLQTIDLSKVKLMWINYPNMPTGQRASREVYEQLISFGQKNNILICSDNPYSFILNQDHISILSIPGASSVALELNSISKSHNMSGWRIGMVAGHKEYIKEIMKAKSNIDSGMFKPVQMAAAHALTLGDEWYRYINQEYTKRRSIAEELLYVLDCSFNLEQAGMFLWAKVPDCYQNGQDMANLLLYKKHILVTPGITFGEQGSNYIRVSLCANENLLEEALKRVKS